MRFLVTGAAGFIGFHLILELLRSKSNLVVGIDNVNDYYDVSLKLDRLNECGIELDPSGSLIQSLKYSNYQFCRLNITNLKSLNELYDDFSFDVVIHLAAQAGVRYSLENPHAYVQSNLVGFVNILECCRKFEVKHLIYASSSSVYGMNNKVPFSEEDRVDNPVSLYAATKRSNELLAYTYSHLYQLPTTGLRFFTVYGPWGRPDMAPMIFTKAILQGKPIKLFNNGDMQRDFTYIDDVVKRIVAVSNLTPSKDNKQPFFDILNLGNSNPIKLKEFISELENLLGQKAIIEKFPMQLGDVKITYSDSSKLNELIENISYTSTSEGLGVFVEWYKSYYQV